MCLPVKQIFDKNKIRVLVEMDERVTTGEWEFDIEDTKKSIEEWINNPQTVLVMSGVKSVQLYEIS